MTTDRVGGLRVGMSYDEVRSTLGRVESMGGGAGPLRDDSGAWLATERVQLPCGKSVMLMFWLPPHDEPGVPPPMSTGKLFELPVIH